MRLCFIVDYRSAIARNWIGFFVRSGAEVHVVSTFPLATQPEGVASVTVVPVGFSSLSTGSMRKYVAVSGAGNHTASAPERSSLSRLAPALNAVAQWLLPWVLPLDAWRRRHHLHDIVKSMKPDLVHAMRIPAEGMLAAEGLRELQVPLLVSVWGNDFTLWARENPVVAWSTRRALRRVDALHTDCHRDHRLALEYGFTPEKPSIVVPGSGGVQLERFAREPVPDSTYEAWGLSPDRPMIFNPRNFRPRYVRNDVFFAAAEQVLGMRPDAQIVCIGMAGNPVAERWRSQLSDPKSVHLLPTVTREQMADLFRMADVSVSPSTHDGTPNTLLEAMACGAYPVVGDVESVREWITDGVNGAVCDAASPASLAQGIVRGLDPETRERAAAHNRRLVEERADFEKVMPEVERFYRTVIGGAALKLSSAPSGSSAPAPSRTAD